jgi:pilus assembly protein CpaC
MKMKQGMMNRTPLTLPIAVLLLAAGLAAPAAEPVANPTDRPWIGAPSASLRVSVALYQSQVISLPAPASRVSVANPSIADLIVISPTQFYVLGKDIGNTNVLVWDRNGSIASMVEVEVTHDLSGLKARLAALLPGNRIQVTTAQRSIVLGGQVPDAATADAAVRLAQSFLSRARDIPADKGGGSTAGSVGGANEKVGEIINLLQIGGAQQVMLQVKVAEIARTELKRLNAKFQALGLNGNWALGGLNGGGSFVGRDDFNNAVKVLGDLSVPDAGLFANYLSSDLLFNLALDAAKEKGLAKILAEPTLTTLTGQEAKFLSGGEFPVPVPQQQNTITIEFKEFGVSLKMLPVVLSSGQINVKLDVAVSELQSGSSVELSPTGSSSTFVVPSLSKRAASGTVELADGQTIGLAGLINDSMRSTVTKFPGLGDLPVLGPLFRSQSWQKGESELVILVTPHLAKPVDTAKVVLPTDGVRDPTDWEFFGLGRQQGLH